MFKYIILCNIFLLHLKSIKTALKKKACLSAISAWLMRESKSVALSCMLFIALKLT